MEEDIEAVAEVVVVLVDGGGSGWDSWFDDNGRSEIDYPERLALEYYYVRNLSLKLDLLCIYKTIIAVITRHGAK